MNNLLSFQKYIHYSYSVGYLNTGELFVKEEDLFAAKEKSRPTLVVLDMYSDYFAIKLCVSIKLYAGLS